LFFDNSTLSTVDLVSESSFFNVNDLWNGLKKSDLWSQNSKIRQLEKEQENLDLSFFSEKIWSKRKNH